MEDKKILLDNLEKVHTTLMGEERVRKNLSLEASNIVEWCKEKIKDTKSRIYRQGKNWYIENADCILTVNAYSYTLITAHKTKNLKGEKKKIGN